jgi:hypothetical protein
LRANPFQLASPNRGNDVRNERAEPDSESNMPAAAHERLFSLPAGQAGMTKAQRFQEARGTASSVTILQSQKIDQAQYPAHRLSLNIPERIPS